jgi:hypothetical protein
MYKSEHLKGERRKSIDGPVYAKADCKGRQERRKERPVLTRAADDGPIKA